MKLKTLCFTIFAVFSIISLPALALNKASCAASQEKYNAKENITNWTCIGDGKWGLYAHWFTAGKPRPDQVYSSDCTLKTIAIGFGGKINAENLQAACNQIYNVKHAFIK